jgi:hypothetical protein
MESGGKPPHSKGVVCFGAGANDLRGIPWPDNGFPWKFRPQAIVVRPRDGFVSYCYSVTYNRLADPRRRWNVSC